jgi:polyhydroxybutyrate depolymerase
MFRRAPRFVRFAFVLALAACEPSPNAPPPAPPVPTGPVPPGPGPGTAAAPLPGQPPAPRTGGSPGCGKVPGHGGAFVGQHVTAAGKDRTYALVLPDAYQPSTVYPVIFVLHGHGTNGAGVRAQMDLERSAAGHAVFLYPDGIGGGWDLDSPTAKNGDVALFDLLLFTVNNTLCVDMNRVFITGFSNGAYMANQLACRRGDRVRAIATHSGGGPYENVGATYDEGGHLICAGKPVAAMVLHGESDTTVAPTEGQNSINHWTFWNKCGSATAPLPSPKGCVAQQGCRQSVVVCKVPGLGHSVWPESKGAIWSFFDALR